jgi:hypothetical protein
VRCLVVRERLLCWLDVRHRYLGDGVRIRWGVVHHLRSRARL